MFEESQRKCQRNERALKVNVVIVGSRHMYLLLIGSVIYKQPILSPTLVNHLEKETSLIILTDKS